jgi:hypothetical protein
MKVKVYNPGGISHDAALMPPMLRCCRHCRAATATAVPFVFIIIVVAAIVTIAIVVAATTTFS